ncbi:MAG: STAS domain-containing protein [Bacteroidia bacterium]
MRFEKSANDHFATIKILDEKLDSRNAADLKKEMLFLVEAEGVRNVVLNMSGISYADSSGLSALLMGNRACRAVGGVQIVCNLNEHVSNLVQISKLDEVLSVLPSEVEAREAILLHVMNSDDDTEEENEGEAASF